jgi:phasin
MPDNVFSAFQMPKFPFPKFEVPDLPVTAPFRDLVQKAAEQATKTIETLDKITDEATKLVEVAGSNAATTAIDYNRKLIEASRENAHAAFEYSRSLMGVTSLHELIELSNSHVKRQFETMSDQARELTALAKKIATPPDD